MRRIALFVFSLLMLFLYFNQAGAKEYDKTKLFSIWVDIGRPISNDDELEGGKTSYNFRFEYCFTRSYFSPSLGLRVGKLPLEGSYDWNWTDVITYMKMEIDRGLLTPYVKAGMGICHLDLKLPEYTVLPSISKNYPVYNMGFGFELIFKKWPVTIFTELDYNIIPISPPIRLPMFREVSSSKMFNPAIGLGFSF